MGSNDHYPEEAPAHRVVVDGFWIDRTAVSNAQFLKFVKATGHVTLAERPADPAAYPDALPELLQPASIVFVPPPGPVAKGDPYRWWQYVAGCSRSGRASGYRAGSAACSARVTWPVALTNFRNWALVTAVRSIQKPSTTTRWAGASSG